MKVFAGVPVLLRERQSNFLQRGGSCAGDNGAGGGTRLISPHVTDQERDIENAGSRVERWQLGPETLSGIPFGAGAFAGHKNGDGRPEESGLYPVIEAMDEHVASAAHGFFAIDVRRRAKGGEHVEIIDDTLTDITVEIVAGAQKAFGADDLADSGVPIALGVLHAFHEHGAVHGQEEAVEWEQVLDTLEELSLEALIGSGGDGTPWHGGGDDGWQEWIGIGLQEGEARVLGELGAAEDGEIFVLGSNAGIGAAFDANAAEGDTPGSGGAGGSDSPERRWI